MKFRHVYMGKPFEFQEAELNHPELLNLPDDIESCEKAAGWIHYKPFTHFSEMLPRERERDNE